MKMSLKLGTALLGILLVSACSTLSQKTSPDDCLVVIKVKMSNPDHILWARDYRLEFSPAYPAVNISNSGRDIVFVVREPSVRISRITSRVSGGGFAGADSEQKVDLRLPYSPGHAVIADFAIIRRLEKQGGGAREYFYADALTDDDRKAAVQELRQKDEFKEWDPE